MLVLIHPRSIQEMWQTIIWVLITDCLQGFAREMLRGYLFIPGKAPTAACHTNMNS